MNTIELTKEQADALMWEEKTPEGFTHIESKNQGESRWTMITWDIFRHDESGKYYAFEWERGLTEMQESDYRKAELFEVVPTPMEKIVYFKAE